MMTIILNKKNEIIKISCKYHNDINVNINKLFKLRSYDHAMKTKNTFIF